MPEHQHPRPALHRPIPIFRHLASPGFKVSLPLAVVAGMASVAAFSPFDAFWLLPLAIALLFRLADGKTPRQAALIGLAYGLGQFGLGTYWILIALAGVGGAPLPLAGALLVGLVILLSLFIALTLALAAR